MSEDLYGSLALSKAASQRQIASAYRKLALQYHPDKNPSPSAAGKFQEISKAYSVLGNPEKREMYDELGIAEFSLSDFDELLEEFLGDLDFLGPLMAFGMLASEESGESLDEAELEEFENFIEANIVRTGGNLVCRVCSKEYSRQDTITRHIANTHGDD